MPAQSWLTEIYVSIALSFALVPLTTVRVGDHDRWGGYGRVRLIQVGEGKIPPYWLILAALTVFSASVPIRLHAIPVALSVSETFVFTSALLFGPAAATLTVAIDAAVISFWSFRRGQSTYKIAFNICALPLTIWISAHLFFWVGGFAPLFESLKVSLPQILGPMLPWTRRGTFYSAVGSSHWPLP